MYGSVFLNKEFLQLSASYLLRCPCDENHALQWAQQHTLTEITMRTGLLSLFLEADKNLVKATTPKTRCFLRYEVCTGGTCRFECRWGSSGLSGPQPHSAGVQVRRRLTCWEGFRYCEQPDSVTCTMSGEGQCILG